MRVAAAAIARNHKDAGFEGPLQHGVAKTVLDELPRDDAPGPSRALPLDPGLLSRYQEDGAQTALGTGWSAGAHSERPQGEAAIDIAMIGLMRDARLRVSEAAELTWSDIERVRGRNRSCACLGSRGYQLPPGERRHYEAAVVDPPWRGRRRACSWHETEPDSDTDRRGGDTGGSWLRLFGGQPPGWA